MGAIGAVLEEEEEAEGEEDDDGGARGRARSGWWMWRGQRAVRGFFFGGFNGLERELAIGNRRQDIFRI